MLGSVAAIGAGVIIWFTGWMPIDPLLSLLICVLIAISSNRLLLDTSRVIMDGTPSGVKPSDIIKRLPQSSPEVVDVHHLHVWSISTSKTALSAHVTARSAANWQQILTALKTTCEHSFAIEHFTF